MSASTIEGPEIESMSARGFSEYNHEQQRSLTAILKAFENLRPSEVERLKESIQPYIHLRRALEEYNRCYFGAVCKRVCFETGLSACCGFESIVTFFADHVINFLLSRPDEISAMMRAVSHPNRSEKCVYLGREGCLWSMSPVSCAMFFCDAAKKTVFEEHPEAESMLQGFRDSEKKFTWPTKPVLFDQLEKTFMGLGVESPHLYFHCSPGLLRLKAKAGLQT